MPRKSLSCIAGAHLLQESHCLALPELIYSEKVTVLHCRSSFTPRKSLSWAAGAHLLRESHFLTAEVGWVEKDGAERVRPQAYKKLFFA